MPNILTINAGSSSIRFAVFECAGRPSRVLDGKMERIGGPDVCLMVRSQGQAATTIDIDATKGRGAVDALVQWLQGSSLAAPAAVGHRVVHGMLHTAPERVSAELLAELRGITPYDPEHLPREIELIEALQRAYPGVPQVACFDTAFHRTMPGVATQLPIPRRYAPQGSPALWLSRVVLYVPDAGIDAHRRFSRSAPAASSWRTSAAAPVSPRCKTAAASIPAWDSRRLPDWSWAPARATSIPGLMSYLALTEPMNAQQFQTMVNHESGLLGVSETSADVRDLLDREANDPRAREALALFCYQAKKWIGSFAAVLGGVDTLVFAGGIGENAAPLRRRICDGLEFLGIEIDELKNQANAPQISRDAAAVAVRVIHTDEEIIIADLTAGLLGLNGK